MKIEVGKKYKHDKIGVVKVLEIDKTRVYSVRIEGSWCNPNDLTPYTEEQEINLDAHIGKVNSDKLYEFSDDGETWYIGQLLHIARKNINPYCSLDECNCVAQYKYCRPYEPKETHKKSIEILTHFNCKCGQWWSIGDFDESIKELYCPKCGTKCGV